MDFRLFFAFLLIYSTVVHAKDVFEDPPENKSYLDVKEERLKTEKELSKSRKAPWLAHILRERPADKRIGGMEVSPIRVPVFLVPYDENFKPMVKLNMFYTRPGWSIFDVYGNEISKKEDSYYLYAYLKSRISTLDLMAVGPGNEVQKERLYIFAPEAREFKTVNIFDSILFTVGHSYLVYRQSSFGRYVAQSLLIGARYMTPEKGKKLGGFAEAFGTIYTYDSSPIDRSSNFLEGRAGLNYSVKAFKNPKVRSKLTFGLNTINLFSLGGGLGFDGLWGPNFGLRSELYKSSRDSFVGEIYYSVYELEDPLKERTIKLSLDWNRALNNMRKAQVGFSYSSHEFSEGLEEISTDLFSVYFSLSF